MNKGPQGATTPVQPDMASADSQQNYLLRHNSLKSLSRSASSQVRMKFFILSLLFLSTRLYGLDADAIRAIAEKPHSRDNLVEALRIYPDAREYKITLQYGESADKLVTGPDFIAEEKTVDGCYIFSKVKFPGEENPLIMMVAYEDKTDLFRKGVLIPDGKITESRGVADFEKRAISWLTTGNQGKSPLTIISIETHTHEMSTWDETTLLREKVVLMSRGKAVKTK